MGEEIKLVATSITSVITTLRYSWLWVDTIKKVREWIVMTSTQSSFAIWELSCQIKVINSCNFIKVTLFWDITWIYDQGWACTINNWSICFFVVQLIIFSLWRTHDFRLYTYSSILVIMFLWTHFKNLIVMSISSFVGTPTSRDRF